MSKLKIIYRVSIITIAPAVMMISFVYHPHIGSPFDADFLEKFASAVTADPARWGIVHYMTGVGCGLMILAFLAIQNHFSEITSKMDPWLGTGMHFIILGNLFYAFLPAMEMGPMAAAEIQADVGAIQGVLMSWFVPTVLMSALLFSIGTVCFATAMIHTNLLNRHLKWLLAVALIVMGLSRFAPLSIIQFYVQGIAGIVALWPITWIVLKHPVIKN